MTTFDPASTRKPLVNSGKLLLGLERLGVRSCAHGLGRPLVMLDMAKIGPGSRVLDVAAGAGDQNLARTAARVGPNGYVLATDISSKILEFAARSARAAGVPMWKPEYSTARI